MKNMMKAQRYRFTHSGVLWTIIAALFFFGEHADIAMAIRAKAAIADMWMHLFKKSVFPIGKTMCGG